MKTAAYAYALLTPSQMYAADEAAMKAGVSGQVLMEAAGAAVAQAIIARWPPGPVSVLCGPGNNGGDGFVAARHLRAAGWPVRLGLLGAPDALSGDAAHHARLWAGAIEPMSPSLLDGAGLVVDALFGAGFSRPLEGAAADTVSVLADSGLPVCAVDVPSGLDGELGMAPGPVAQACLTVTFFRKKPGHVLLPGRQLCGDVVVADIGIPDAVLDAIEPLFFENHPALWLHQFPWPRVDTHKYQRGHALVVGGRVMTGAARLAATACARMGAGLVTVAAPLLSWPIYASALTSIMVHPVRESGSLGDILADARINVVVLGPGAGISELTRRQALQILQGERAVVLDADAISVFGNDPQVFFDAIQGPCVLTPHDGEFNRVFPGGDKIGRAHV